VTCKMCGKETPEREKTVNGHTIKMDICISCEEKKKAEYDAFPKQKKGKK
jgi:ribosome-binding protein aMBF1 (putative translation factor)